MCSKPFRLGNDEYGCGQCMPCRINRRRVWTARLMLEASAHAESCFITLTYDEAHLPKDRGLQPREVQLWVKRLRSFIRPLRVRYYLVGEYGEEKKRPHYHVALFGFRPADHIHPRMQKLKRVGCRCVVCSAWKRGGVDVAELTAASAGYIVSYILKGMTRPRSLGELHPEFARMSTGGRTRRGGIGAPGVDDVTEQLTSKEGSEWFARVGDVPTQARVEGRGWPLGRYLRNRLSKGAGLSDEYRKLLIKERSKLEVLESRESRDRRERARKQHAWNAINRARISNSKKLRGGPDETQ